MSSADNAPEKKVPEPPPAPKPAGGARRAPVLVEILNGLSRLAVTVVGAGTALAAILAGTDWLGVAVRAGAAVLLIGIVLWLLNWFVARGALEAARQQLAEAAQQAQPGAIGEWQA